MSKYIDAKDLMIGDWVTCRKWIEKPFKLMTLSERKGDFFYGRTSEKSIVGPFFIESLDPIPLTPEILEKNGFKNSEFFGELLYKDWQIMSDCHHLAARCCDGWNFDIPCEFVHELQHAFRLCGIEKEIEL